MGQPIALWNGTHRLHHRRINRNLYPRHEFGTRFTPDLRTVPPELGQQAEWWSPYPIDSPLNTSITYSPKLPVRKGSNGVLFTTDYPSSLAFCASNLYWGADVWKRLSGAQTFSKTIYRAHGSEEWRHVTSDETGRPQIHEFFNPKANFASQDIHKRILAGTCKLSCPAWRRRSTISR